MDTQSQFKYNIGQKVVYMMGTLPLQLTIKNRWLYRKRLMYSVEEMGNQFKEEQITLAD